MLTKKDYEYALMVQSAVNLSGVVNSFARVLVKIWEEANETGNGTDWVNAHPICRLYAEQIAFLSGAGTPSNYESWEKAYAECEEKSKLCPTP